MTEGLYKLPKGWWWVRLGRYAKWLDHTVQIISKGSLGVIVERYKEV